jgi:hypothetical protein
MKRILLAVTFLALGVVLGYFAGRPSKHERYRVALIDAIAHAAIDGLGKCGQELENAQKATCRGI